MGYRSEVVFAIDKKLYFKNSKKLKKGIEDVDSVFESENAFYFRWDSVKWYDSFEDVMLIENFTDKHSKDTALFRIGEEDDDLVQKGNYEFGLYFHRSISIPNAEEMNKEEFFNPPSVKFIQSLKK